MCLRITAPFLVSINPLSPLGRGRLLVCSIILYWKRVLLDGIAERVYSPIPNRREHGKYSRLAARCPGNAHSQGLVFGALAWLWNPAPYSTDIRGTIGDPAGILLHRNLSA